MKRLNKHQTELDYYTVEMEFPEPKELISYIKTICSLQTIAIIEGQATSEEIIENQLQCNGIVTIFLDAIEAQLET